MKRKDPGQNLANALKKMHLLTGEKHPAYDDLLTPEWARRIDAQVAAHERQLKILNATILTALLADIATRLLK